MATSNGTRNGKAIDTTPAPKAGELTGHQSRWSNVFAALADGLPGWDAPAPGTYDTYRLMRTDPTIAMARAAAMAPIKGAAWSVEADDDAPDDAVQLITDLTTKHRGTVLIEGLRALDYGWQPMEMIWGNSTGALTVERFKPLLPDISEIMVGAGGGFVGLKQGAVTIGTFKTFLPSYDAEAGNLYGRSRMENIRRHAWGPWMSIAKQLERYFAKAAGIIPQITYPVGKTEGPNGEERDNGEWAERILANLGKGNGVAMPTILHPWMDDALTRQIDISAMIAWQIKFLETRAGHGAEYTAGMQYHDVLKVRGWLVPERSVIEGQFGTKAEAGVHANLGLQVAEETSEWLAWEFNRQAVDRVLSVNFGPAMAGKVRAVPAKLTSDERSFMRELIRGISSNPASIEWFLTATDLDAMLDQGGVPKSQEVVPQPEPAPSPSADPNAPAKIKPQGPPERPLTAAFSRIYRKHRATMN